ncbi:hypothetical protein LBMAG42_37700 [Deltaproteobacteria bacterium]|nr:hypothetical protein LBMAG42_37700 [Deltaproteobacteria bacterium]
MQTERRGQSTVEWALVLAVLAIAVVAAGYAFVPSFQTAMDSAGDGMKTVYTSGTLPPP